MFPTGIHDLDGAEHTGAVDDEWQGDNDQQYRRVHAPLRDKSAKHQDEGDDRDDHEKHAAFFTKVLPAFGDHGIPDPDDQP